MKGFEKSMTLSLAAVTVRSAAMRSISSLINIPTNPFKKSIKSFIFSFLNLPIWANFVDLTDLSVYLLVPHLEQPTVLDDLNRVESTWLDPHTPSSEIF